MKSSPVKTCVRSRRNENLSGDEVDRRSGGKLLNVLDRGVEDALDGFLRIKGEMRRHDDARVADEIVVLEHDLELFRIRMRRGEKGCLIVQVALFFKDIESGARKRAVL